MGIILLAHEPPYALRRGPIAFRINTYLLVGASMATVQISARIDARHTQALDDLSGRAAS